MLETLKHVGVAGVAVAGTIFAMNGNVLTISVENAVLWAVVFGILGVAAFATNYLGKVFPKIGNVITAGTFQNIFEFATTFAINATKGAAPDQPLTKEIGSEVVVKMLRYALAAGSGVIGEIGDTPDMLVRKAIARLQFVKDAGFSEEDIGRLVHQAFPQFAAMPADVGIPSHGMNPLAAIPEG